MSNARDIRGKIKSTQNMSKITAAMEMVAKTKMRRTQENMQRGRPYAENILRLVSHLASAHPEGNHPFFTPRAEDKASHKTGYILVSTDRGLCGGLNLNLFKAMLNHMREEEARGQTLRLSVFGRKGAAFAGRIGAKIISAVEGYGDNPSSHKLIGAITPMVSAFRRGELDRVFLVHNVFVNSMVQRPQVLQLLPVAPPSAHEQALLPQHYWDYLYEPSAEVLLEKMAERYIESVVREAVFEGIACEMAARAVAMKAATDNAKELIERLRLQYNKARQAAITQELTEIVAGAAAV